MRSQPGTTPKKKPDSKAKKTPSAVKQQREKNIFEIMKTPEGDRAAEKSKVAKAKVQQITTVVPGIGRIGSFKRTSSSSSSHSGASVSHGMIRKRSTKLPSKYKDSSIDPDSRKNKKPVTPTNVSLFQFFV